jgi:hypothetical protein
VDESSAAGLVRLLLNSSEKREVRRQALFGLTRLEESPRLPLSDLATLLHDRMLWDDSCACPERSLFHSYGVSIALLRLCQGEEATHLARSFLALWPAEGRSRLLRDLPTYFGEPDSALVNWLYQQWLSHDRFQIEEVRDDAGDPWPLNLRVALAHSDRPESRSLLREFWQRASSEQRLALLEELWCSLGEEIGCLATGPRERQELAEALALPVADLLQHLGPERLLDRIEASLRDASRAIAAAPWPHPPSWMEQPGRALDFLAQWPDASPNARIASLIGCPDLQMVLRRELLDVLWKREPALALAILRRAVVEPALLPLAEWLLPWVCRRPRPEDGEFFRCILKQEAHPVVRYHSVKALERLGEHGIAWWESLARMTRSRDPYLRIRALGALARRGEATHLHKLERIAKKAKHVCVRAEAIRVLAELDAASYVGLFRRALLEDHAMCGHCPSDLPAAAEAAIALSRLGTPEALTALVRGCLTVPDQDLQSWIGFWLGQADEPQQERSIACRNRCWGICRDHTLGRCHYRRWHDDDEQEES